MTSSAAYDPEARRDTPLAEKIKSRIRCEGPITVRDYMRTCLHEPEHGYYACRPAIGAGGDFVTAPEISQVFGELIGLWAAVVWQQMGSPSPFSLVELGPGRGTLMRDALRAARRLPDFLAAAELHLVEVSPELRRHQAHTLRDSGCRPTWHHHLTEVPAAAAIVVGNEFVDALPVEQYVRQTVGWRRRTVGLDAADRLVLGIDTAGPRYFPRAAPPDARPGDIVEHRMTMDLAFGLSRLARPGPVACLLIDYGHVGVAVGDTLQAVRNHAFEHPLASPGEADLTTQVEFASLADNAASFDLAVDGPVPQARYLGALGIMQRASRLMAANPGRAPEIEAGIARLMSPTGMGTRFKAIGIRSRHLPPLPGFD